MVEAFGDIKIGIIGRVCSIRLTTKDHIHTYQEDQKQHSQNRQTGDVWQHCKVKDCYAKRMVNKDGEVYPWSVVE
jgi:hypothetical protein